MSTPQFSYGSWPLDHPVLGILIVAACALAGWLLGVGAATVTTDHHMISPGNVVAGAGMGIGGVVLGCVVAAVIVTAVSRRSRP